MHPAKTEITALEKIAADADKVAADASRWFSLRDTARTSLAAAETAFLATLDSKAAATLTGAANNVRALSVACDALAKAGGPDAFRRARLYARSTFAIFSAGFAKRYDELEKLKLAARAVYSARVAEALADGHVSTSGLLDVFTLERVPAVAELRSVLDALDHEAQAALVSRNTTAAPDKHPAREFDELLSKLSAPLPVVPAA